MLLCGGLTGLFQKCPFEAIEIINLPKNLERDTTHRYGPNSFKLHRLPMPRPGQVLGLVGTNGIGQLPLHTAHRARGARRDGSDARFHTACAGCCCSIRYRPFGVCETERSIRIATRST